jgi:hypothetical protein
VEFFFVAVVDGVRIGVGQESGKLRFRDKAIIPINDEYGVPLKDQEVVLHYPDGSEVSAKSDSGGMVVDNKEIPGVVFVELKYPE